MVRVRAKASLKEVGVEEGRVKMGARQRRSGVEAGREDQSCGSARKAGERREVGVTMVSCLKVRSISWRWVYRVLRRVWSVGVGVGWREMREPSRVMVGVSERWLRRSGKMEGWEVVR